MQAACEKAGFETLDEFKQEIATAFLIRLTEERLLELFKEGKLFGTVHTCVGQEFVGVSVARVLGESDTIFSNHRCHGHFLAYRPNLTGLIGEVMGKSIGVCGGRGGSQHLHYERFYSNGVQGGIVPVAVGLGLGHKLHRSGGISVVFIGDGTFGEGVLYEALNIASKWALPVLIVCENNLYAQSTEQGQTLSGTLLARAAAFGIATRHSDTWHWENLFRDMEASVNLVRDTGRPCFHQVDTYRLNAHSKGDDNRAPAEVADYQARDPLNRITSALGDDARFQGMIRDLRTRVDAAVQSAEAAPPCEGVVTERMPVSTGNCAWAHRSFPRERIVASICRTLGEVLSEKHEAIIFGEDVESPYGGAFKCTQGLSEQFPGRVLNTPISEACIVGLGNGLALSGLLPIVEIMFGDFVTLIMDQWVNHAAKFRWMYNDRVKVPLIIRTPMGGKRGYGPTHSQSLEKHVIGLPGTQVLCLHHRYSPALLYRDLVATIDRPTVVIENKILYGAYASSDPPPGFQLVFSPEPFPTARLVPNGKPQLTILAVGGVSLDAEAAVLRLFDEEEIAADLFLPSRLYPFDISVVAESLAQTRCLFVVEEGQGFASWSSEVLAQTFERFGSAGITCRRQTAAPVPIPSARTMEKDCLPDGESIYNAALELYRNARF